jgi:Rhs element Vgr protein
MPQDRAIPTTRPSTVLTTLVKVDGTDMPEKYKAEAIIVSSEVNRIPYAKLVIVDGSAAGERFEASNDAMFQPGKEVEIQAGYQSDNQLLFKGIIIKHSIRVRGNGSSVMIIECRDKVTLMSIGRKNKYFTEKKDSEAIEEIVGTYSGLSADVEATSVTQKQLVQYDATDWDFMLSRADVNQRLCIVENGIVNIKKPDLTQSPVLSLVYGASILDLDLEIDTRLQFRDVKTSSWSSDDQAVTEVQIDNPNKASAGNISADDLAAATSPSPYDLKHGGDLPEQELDEWGKSLWIKRQLAKVRGKVNIKGTHEVKAGVMLELQGVGNRFTGKIFVSGVQHQISAGDWQSAIQVGLDPDWFADLYDISSKPAAGLLPAINGLQTGIVTQLESDPDGKNRIKVYLPIIHSGEEGIWTRVATLDAGNERGSFFLPEIGDEVIVGFINDDPREAVVLGMMNSSAKPAPLAASDDNHIKGFVTRSKIKMLFDDDKKIYSLETPGGKKFTLDDDANEIKLEDDNGNVLTMDKDGIKMESAGKIEMKATKDFKIEGLNVEAKASAGYTASGGGSAELSSNGVTKVKGSMVQIN